MVRNLKQLGKGGTMLTCMREGVWARLHGCSLAHMCEGCGCLHACVKGTQGHSGGMRKGGGAHTGIHALAYMRNRAVQGECMRGGVGRRSVSAAGSSPGHTPAWGHRPGVTDP